MDVSDLQGIKLRKIEKKGSQMLHSKTKKRKKERKKKKERKNFFFRFVSRGTNGKINQIIHEGKSKPT